MDAIIDRTRQIHQDCHILCSQTLGININVAGNIGIFCQSENEYSEFLKLKEILTKPSNNPLQKYFELVEPIKIEKEGQIPEATYTYLYIRKPDSSPYGKYLGDIDFIMDDNSYEKLKNDIINGKYTSGVELYDRPNWDTVQITDHKITSVAYISTKQFAEKVRVKFD